jgi:hypothetical protein
MEASPCLLQKEAKLQDFPLAFFFQIYSEERN